MLSYAYPFWRLSYSNQWYGCKPALIFCLLYFSISWIYRKINFPSEKNTVWGEKRDLLWVFVYGTMLLLYFFYPSTGQSDTLLTQIAKIYLQYESLLSFAIFEILIFTILRKPTWQHIRILDQTAVLLTLGSILFTLLVRQVNSLLYANLFWFVVFGLVCARVWHWWENYSPPTHSDSNSNSSSSFLPIKSYELLSPRRQLLADHLADMILTHNANEPLSICIAGEWGVGKTSVVNGAVDRLKKNPTSRQYEYLYINTMELDTLGSLFSYVFARIRSILKRRGAYVGIGSEYRQFLTSAVGKITDGSLAAIIESRLFPSSEDYRSQIKNLEDCISSVLKNDKILIIVDDVERCNNEKAQQFIFFIKEIATIRNCVTIFLADYEYLNQRLCANLSQDANALKEKNYFFFEKFFNCRIDIPPIVFEEVIEQIEQDIRKKARKLGFRPPSELFGVFEEKLQQMEGNFRKEAEKGTGSTEKLLSKANKVNQMRSAFRSTLSFPRTLVKYCNAMGAGYSRLTAAYVENGVLKPDASSFFSLIRFDEILFLLVYIEACAPYEALCLKEHGLTYLQCPPDATDDTRKLIEAMGEDLLYSSEHIFLAADKDYRYNEASRFTQAYLDNGLPKTVKGFSSRDDKWLSAIEANDHEEIRTHWAEMVQMVAQNFGLKEPEKGERYLGILFSFAKEHFFASPDETEQVFSIFERSQRNESTFSHHIAVMKIFEEILGEKLTECSQENIKLLEQFSNVYFWNRSTPICNAAYFMAPAEASKDDALRQKMSNANEIMLYDYEPTDNLNKLLEKLCDEIPSINIPPDDDVFRRLRSFTAEEEKYLTEKGLIQYDDIINHVHLLKTAVEDMEHFVLLLRKVKKNMISTGDSITSLEISDMDKSIQRFKAALATCGGSVNTSLQFNLQTMFNELRSGDVKLSDRHYEELQSIITESEKLYGPAPYFRKILVDHQERTKMTDKTTEDTDNNLKS